DGQVGQGGRLALVGAGTGDQERTHGRVETAELDVRAQRAVGFGHGGAWIAERDEPRGWATVGSLGAQARYFQHQGGIPALASRKPRGVAAGAHPPRSRIAYRRAVGTIQRCRATGQPPPSPPARRRSQYSASPPPGGRGVG